MDKFYNVRTIYCQVISFNEKKIYIYITIFKEAKT